MSDVQVTESSVQGFRALTAANGLVSITIVPELGGKIRSIRDLRTGREWMWTNPRLPYRRFEYGASHFEEGDTGGWDECFPTVAECSYPLAPWRGARMPDHGELWPQRCREEVETAASGGAHLRTAVEGVALPYIFERDVVLEPDSDKVRLEYALTSTSNSEIAFIWSVHPLFFAEPGMCVLLPHDAQMRVYLSFPSTILDAQAEHRWPVRVEAAHEVLDFSELPDASAGIAFKLWSQPLSEGWAALVANDGEFRFTFDPELVPQVGLWVNAGGWSGTGGEPYYNLAMEPCIGAQDSLEEAIECHDQYATLPARGVRKWWLEAQSSPKAFGRKGER